LARRRTQTVFGSGNPYTRLVFMGEAPGADEDRQGLPFVGRAGQLLTDIIVKAMKLRREDIYILNTIKCRPPGNRTPTAEEAANCREYLDQQLDVIRPEFICCLGAVAAQNLLMTTASIGQLRGKIHDLRGIKVVCTYHPAFLLRTPEAKRQAWEDIQLLMKEMGLPTGKK
jgi:DNA polymerase